MNGKPSTLSLGFFSLSVVNPMRIFSFVLAIIIFLSSAIAFAQDGLYEVHTLRFIGNKNLSDDLLLQVIQTRETPAAFWKFLHKISDKLGQKAEYFDPIVVEADYLRLTRFYNDQGFLESKIDTSIHYDEKRKRLNLTFNITEGRRSFIDTLVYHGVEGMPSIVIDEVKSKPFVKIGDPYVIELVEKELRRYVNAFANNGYAGVKVENIRVQHYASTNNVKVTFAIEPGVRYRFGQISVEQIGRAHV